jgi:tetratricopeptide (TPR) repeat protein
MSVTMVLSSSWVWILAGIAAALMLIFFVDFYRKEESLGHIKSEGSAGPALNLDSKSPQWIQKKAQQLTRLEAYRMAADLYHYLQKYDEAASLYLKGKNYIKAAEDFLHVGRREEAAKIYESIEDHEQAAQCYLDAGDMVKAGETYLRSGLVYRAARLFEQGGDYLRAAEAYQESAFYRRAAELFESAGEKQKAGNALKRSCEQVRSLLPEDVSTGDSRPFKNLCLSTGKMYLSCGLYQEAVEAFEAGGHHRESGQAYEDAGRSEEAAEAYLKAGVPFEAARVLEEEGELKRAAGLRAWAYLLRGERREALEHLERAEEYEEAAGLYEELGERHRAAEMYEKAGEYRKAGELFAEQESWVRAAECMARIEDWRKAAEYYGRAQDFSRQAEAYERAGDYYYAGENYYRRGLLDRAIQVLQQVSPKDEGFSKSSALLGKIFKEKGIFNLARESFHLAVENKEISRGNMDNYYQYAMCSEKLGEIEEAMNVYEKILLLDFHYQDVQERMNLLKQQRTLVDSRLEHVYEDTQVGPETTSPQPVSVDRVVRYEIMDEVGRGGMGIVYRARDTILDRVVAYKVLPANLMDHPQALKNFFREAKSAAKLNHPNIVTVYDAGEEAGNYYIAMEYIDGETVKELLSREGRLPLKALLLIAGQVCRAMEYAHARKVVHRDIKSSNIMWTREKAVKLMDFGLAKVLEEVKGYQTIASGTPYYMSPEQTLGKDIDYRTDIYSLGVTMFEIATGRLPFATGDAAYHHVHTPPPEARSILPEIPDSLSQIILRCMQKEPADRFQSARELFDALKAVK